MEHARAGVGGTPSDCGMRFGCHCGGCVHLTTLCKQHNQGPAIYRHCRQQVLSTLRNGGRPAGRGGGGGYSSVLKDRPMHISIQSCHTSSALRADDVPKPTPFMPHQVTRACCTTDRWQGGEHYARTGLGLCNAQLCTIRHDAIPQRHKGSTNKRDPGTANLLLFGSRRDTTFFLIFRQWKNFTVLQSIFSSGNMCRCISVDNMSMMNTTINCMGEESSRTLCTSMHNYARLCKSAKVCIIHNYAQLCMCIIFPPLQVGACSHASSIRRAGSQQT